MNKEFSLVFKDFTTIEEILFQKEPLSLLLFVEKGSLTLNNQIYLTSSLVIAPINSITLVETSEASLVSICYFETAQFELLFPKTEVTVFDFPLSKLYFDELKYELSTPRFGMEVMLNQILTNLYIQCIRQNENDRCTITNKHKRLIVNKASTYVRNNLEVISVQKLASELSLSPNYLYKLFMDVHQMSIQEYILKIKIEESINLLKSNKYSMKEIATALNFSSQNHFSNTFKRYMHITPTNYRNKLHIF